MAMLDDVRVCEVAGHVGAAFAGKLFAALGADVVKVEPYPAGDLTRAATTGGGPAGAGGPGDGAAAGDAPAAGGPGAGDDSALFLFLNTGKKSLTANLAHERGLDLLYRLLATVDVLFVDLAALSEEHPGTPLAVARLPERFPSLVVVATSPFGAAGPYRDFRGSEHVIFQAGGEGYLLGAGLNHEQFPDRPPVGAGGYLAGYQTGLTAAAGALAALLDREHTGAGQFVDVSAQDAQLSLNHLPVMRYADGVLETTANRGFTFGGVMPCADGYVEVLPLEEHQWRDLVALMGEPEWAADPRFATGRDRARHGAELNRHLRRWIGTRTRAELAAIGQTSACPIAPYYDLDEAMANEHSRQRGAFQEIAHPRAGTGSYPRLPMRLGVAGEPVDERPAPGLGEHTLEVCSAYLGLREREVAELRAVGAL
jgi:crotonobetainyl-CoA:carnitine CoA-transferase CaiB-like acyl-CoA transferase